MLVAIVSLSAVLALVLALHLYARFVLRRQARRRAAIHQLTLTVAAHNTTQFANEGLDATLINALPTFILNKSQEDESEECAVCLSALEHEEKVRLLPNCKHTFHVSCIDTWLTSHSTCPVCRTKVEPTNTGPKLELQPREGPVLIGPHDATAPSAPVLFEPGAEGTSDSSPKIHGSNPSRLSSFRRMLSRERSLRRIQPSSCDDIVDHDLERQ